MSKKDSTMGTTPTTVRDLKKTYDAVHLVVTVDSVLSYSRDTRKGKWPILIFRTKVLTVVYVLRSGAIASVAALYFADLDPTVITFGQMAAIDKPCTLINSDKYYRFENSRAGYFGSTYDPIPNLPYFASHFGHQIMLGDDATGVAYIGKDTHVHFRPYDTDRAFRTHRLVPKTVGYLNRVENLAAHYEPRIEPTAVNDTVYDCFLKNSSTATTDFVLHDEADEDTSATSMTDGAKEEIDQTTVDEDPLQSSLGGKLDVDDITASSSLRGNNKTAVTTGVALMSMEEPNKTSSDDEDAELGAVEHATVVVLEPMVISNATDNQDTVESDDDSNTTNVNVNVTAAEKEHPELGVGNETSSAGDILITGDKNDQGPERTADKTTASSSNRTEDASEQTPEIKLSPANNSGITNESQRPPEEEKTPKVEAVTRPKYLVRSNGFVNDSRCSKDVECVSRNCKRKRCRPHGE